MAWTGLWRVALGPRSQLAIVLLLFAAPALVACRTADQSLTATADFHAAATQLKQIHSTATVARARLQTTLDFVGTRVAQIEQSGAFLRSNLSALGTDSAFIDASLRQLRDSPPELGAAQAEATSTAAASAALEPDVAAAQPLTASPPPPSAAPALGPRLEEPVLTSGVNSQDCPIDINPVFNPASTAIYVVARAFEIPAGATFSSSWRYRGEEVAAHSFTTENSINDNCIWFYIDQTDVVFTAGRWTVQISLDSRALIPLLPFEIVDS